MKSKTTALILSILLGGMGVDRFYLGYIGMGVLKLLTAGCFGILWIIDIINIASGKLVPADGSGYAETVETSNNYNHNSEDSYDKLKKIADLHKSGAIDDDEYNQMKKDLLEKM